MKFETEKIKSYLEAHPEKNKRRYQYQIISDLTSVDEETCKAICSLQRIIRMELPAEEDKHYQETEALDNLGYYSQAIHDRAEQGQLM